jgi:hypothetical protein
MIVALLLCVSFHAAIPKGFMPGTTSPSATHWLEMCGAYFDLDQVDVVIEADGTQHPPESPSHHPGSDCWFALLFFSDQATQSVFLIAPDVILMTPYVEAWVNAKLPSRYIFHHPRAPPVNTFS